MSSLKFWIGGKQTVKAALQNPARKIFEICSTSENLQFFNQLEKELNKKFNINYKETKHINKLFKNNISHQGVAVLIEKTQTISTNDFLLNIKSKTESSVVILDDITDQRNIGSIIRTSAAFCIDAVFILNKNFNHDNESMYKAASGAIELIPIIPVVNIVNTIEKLKNNNFWISGLDIGSNKNIIDYQWNKKVAIILGSEGKGMRDLVKKNCDDLIKININPAIDSLNVSNALAATLAIKYFQKKNPEK